MTGNIKSLLEKIEKDDFLGITLDELLAHWGSERYSPVIQATVCHLEELKRLRERAIHLSSGGRDPDEKCYSKRDVEALVAACRALEKMHE